MKQKKESPIDAFIALSDSEKRKQIARFDREFSYEDARPLSAADRAKWNRAKRRPGRPKTGLGAERISVTVEKSLLARADALAKSHHISRAELIARGLLVLLSQKPRRASA